MSTLITILHVTVCLFLMLTVLMQEGKSGGMGGAFGGSNAGTVFGGSGSSSFLRKLTTVCATTFMLTSVILAYLASHNAADSLEKFGSAEAKRAAQKQEAIDKALQSQGSGSDAGSASGPSIMMPGPSEMGSSATGSATTPSTGSATTPEAGSAATGSAAAPASGSAATAEKPTAEKPTAEKPTAEKPATPAQPSMTPATAEKVTPPAAPPAKAATPVEKKAPAPAQSPSEKAADKSAEKKPLTGTAAPVNPQPAEVPAPSTNP